MSETVDFQITEFTTYQISCGGCGEAVIEEFNGGDDYYFIDEFDSAEDVIEQANKLGFGAVHTPEDGTLNFCAECKKTL